MSGTEIPLQTHPIDPFIGTSKVLANEQAAASIGQTQSQANLLGEQARTAQIGNQIQSARLPFLMQAYGGANAGGGQPGGGGGGPPGAIGASGDQDWTGANGVIPDPNLFGQLGAIPKGIYTQLILAPADKWIELGPKVRDQKNAYVNQAVSGTIDPETGQADPAKWNQMISKEVNDGWMTASQARSLWGHPEMAQTLLNSTLPVNEQPGTRQAQAGAEQAGRAPYKLVDVNVKNPDGTFQTFKVPKASLLPGQTAGGGGGGARGGRQGEIPADLATGIQRASKVYEVPANDLTTMARIESGGNFSGGANSPTGPKGTFQFTQGTADQVGVANPRDNGQAAMGAARLWRENKADLTDTLGRTPASSEIYLAHQQGAQGAAALLQAPPGILAVDALKQAGISPRNVLVNGGTPTMTAGQFVDKWRNTWNSYASRGQQQQGAQVAGPGAPTEPAAPNPNAPVQIPPTGPSQPMGGGAVAAAGPPQLSPQVNRLADLDKEQIQEDAKTNSGNLQAGLNANKAGVTMRELRDLAVGAPTGAWADQRVAFQSMATQFGGPLGQRLATLVTGIDKPTLSQMEQINKLALNNVVSQEQAIGPGTRIGAMFTNFFAKASPNINMQEPAIHQILNMGIVAQQMAKDYANDSNAHFTQARDTTAESLAAGSYKRFQPLNKLEGQWTASDSIHSPSTYAAAANLLNGTPPSKAFRGLSNDQQVEALRIIQRADPESMKAVLALRGK